MSTLVTGGTGTLGQPTVEALRKTGTEVRVLSRKPGPRRVTGNLSTGEGLADALAGVDTVLHLATTRRKDSGQTRVLLDALAASLVSHLIFISIVGVDQIPYFYYRDKTVSERMIEASGIPFTTLRATQFHDFVADLFRMQRRLPTLFALDIEVQPIAVEEVANRLVELAGATPAGRVADIGGPEQLAMRELAEIWQEAQGTTKKIRTLRIPGKTIAAFKAGHHLTAVPGYGTETFAEYAQREAAQ
ncbi:MAG: SDR family oxidoreductase [Salinibacterium sp.]|nr:MAG: SDR family oxidoreductase [Salinibacterium sp.]